MRDSIGMVLMAFTDDELRVLKSMCEQTNIPINGKELIGFIARLDAAEALVTMMAPHFDAEEMRLYEAWKRSKGE